MSSGLNCVFSAHGMNLHTGWTGELTQQKPMESCPRNAWGRQATHCCGSLREESGIYHPPASCVNKMLLLVLKASDKPIRISLEMWIYNKRRTNQANLCMHNNKLRHKTGVKRFKETTNYATVALLQPTQYSPKKTPQWRHNIIDRWLLEQGPTTSNLREVGNLPPIGRH